MDVTINRNLYSINSTLAQTTIVFSNLFFFYMDVTIKRNLYNSTLAPTTLSSMAQLH